MTPEAFLNGSFHERLAAFLLIGAEFLPIQAFAPEALAEGISALLIDPEFETVPSAEQGAVFFRIHIIYATSWDSAGQRVIPAAEAAFGRLAVRADAPLTALCLGYDALFFLHWCWETRLERQVSFASRVVSPFAAAIRARAVRGAPEQAIPGRIGYLAQFISPGPGNAIAPANAVILRALTRRPGQPAPILYAWMFHDQATLDALRQSGVDARAINGNSPAERFEALDAMIRADRPEILISDMNGAIPGALFEQRLAPLQILYQFGMPFWPLQELDWVFHCWDFDPKLVGFDARRMTRLTIPYDLTPFGQPADAQVLATEVALLPKGRLIGTYGRLSKISPAFLEAVAAAIREIPDVTVVLGGSGDAGPLRAAITALPEPERFDVHERFINGHVWGNLLDVFLDTFEVPGGASCLEVIAKGKPVVSLRTLAAPNLARYERASMLTSTDAAGYSAVLRRLLTDPRFMAKAQAATRSLAARYPKPESYPALLAVALDEARRGPQPRLLRLLRNLFR